jgi:hypothetical protein
VHDQFIILIVSACIQAPIAIFLMTLLVKIYMVKLKLWDVIVLILLMIIANISWILSQVFQFQALKNGTQVTEIDTLATGISLGIACCCFSLSHWIFSFKYWKCS